MPSKIPLPPMPALTPPPIAARPTAFQLNFSWMPVATPMPWLTIEPTAAAPAPIAVGAAQPDARGGGEGSAEHRGDAGADRRDRRGQRRRRRAGRDHGDGDRHHREQHHADHAALVLLAPAWGCGVEGVTSPIASAGLYGLKPVAL